MGSDNEDEDTGDQSIKQKSAPIHADDMYGEMTWASAPKTQQQIYINTKDNPVYKTGIPENYVQVKCAACTHQFWMWVHQSTVNCPQCHMPLYPKFKLVPDEG